MTLVLWACRGQTLPAEFLSTEENKFSLWRLARLWSDEASLPSISPGEGRNAVKGPTYQIHLPAVTWPHTHLHTPRATYAKWGSFCSFKCLTFITCAKFQALRHTQSIGRDREGIACLGCHMGVHRKLHKTQVSGKASWKR